MSNKAAAGRKRATTNTITVPIRIEREASEAPPAASFSGVPLFEQVAGDADERIDRIQIVRTAPIEEGHLGYVEPDASEEDISNVYGGGTFRLQAKTDKGRPIAGGFKTVKIAGEPKFGNALSLARWKRIKKQEARLDSDDEPEERSERRREPDVLTILDMQERKAEMARQLAREDADRREREREAEHKRELERMRIEAGAREQERRAEDERRDRDRTAADERRARDQDAQTGRDREFMAGMARLHSEQSKSGGLGHTLELLAAAKELFSPGGDGAGDPVTALVQNLPAILGAGSNIAAQMETKPNPAPVQTPQQKGITLTGPHAVKLAQAVKHLRDEGIDPSAALLQTLDALRTLKGPKKEPSSDEPSKGEAEADQDEGEEKPDAGQAAPRPVVRRRPVQRRR